jgi:hypothetical protein
MYEDPRFIKKHVYKVCLNDEEKALIDARARAQGKQRSVLLRELIMTMVHGLNGDGQDSHMEGQNDGRKTARSSSSRRVA